MPRGETTIGRYRWDPQLFRASARKAGFSRQQLCDIFGVAYRSTTSWFRTTNPTHPHGTLLRDALHRFSQHAASERGVRMLRELHTRLSQAPKRRLSHIMLDALFGTRVAPVDYSWARFLQRERARLLRGRRVQSDPFRTFDDFAAFAAVMTNPRDVAARLDMPDPKLPDWETKGTIAWPNNPNNPNSPNDPPAPPAVIGGMPDPTRPT